jgi:hypothetical protein
VDTSKFTPGVIVILAAALVTLVFSFLSFYTFDGAGGDVLDDAVEACRDQAEAAGLDPDDVCEGAEGARGDESFSAWTTDTRGGLGLFPVATLPAIYGVLMAAQVALARLANVRFPARVVGLTWAQIHIAVGFNAALIMLAFLVRDKGNFDFGVGFYLMLLGSLALAVGAVLFQREAAAGPAVPPPPPSAPPPPPA